MKSCPKCSRTFPDDGQKFCTFDGGLLVTQQTFDPEETISASAADMARHVNSASEAPTNRELPDKVPSFSETPTSRDLPDPYATIAATPYPPSTTVPRNTGPTKTTGSVTGEFPPMAATVVQKAPPSISPPRPVAKKRSKLPWIIAGVLLVLFLGVGALAGIFFVVIKPRLDGTQDRPTVAENPPPIVETNKNTATTKPVDEVTNKNTNAPTETEAFVAPPNSVQFTNSQANLDGKLAEHYLDFSFFYPNSWSMDRNAGKSGSSNFVKVERRLPPDFTQENFAVGWYTSQGTFAGDLPTYPQLVELLGANISKNFPDYRKVSEGPTKINSMDGYEFRFESLSKGTSKGDIQLWGRVVFLPPGVEGQKTGATLIMLSTSLAPELSGVEDVGTKGEMPIILESFRFGKKK
jgi:flagellar basal body-associated protein FliL